MSGSGSDRAVIGVVGAGAMGAGIVQWAAEAGHPVIAFDARPGAVAAATAKLADLLERGIAKGRTTAEAAAATLARITAAESLAAFAPADVVVEAIVEDLEAKRGLFRELEAIVRPDAVLATNTSSLSVTAVAAATAWPERVAGLHFFNPVPLMKVVEVIPGLRTAPAVGERLAALVAATGHRAVVCRDTPGFLVNHAGRAYSTEGLRIVQEGVGEPADVDRVMTEAAGFRMGPFELFDLTGLDVSNRVMDEIYGQFYQEPRYRPSPIAGRRVAAGLFGRKSGEGFYRYEDGRKLAPPESAPPDSGPPGSGPAVWLGAATADVRPAIEAALAEGGATIAGDETAPDAAVIVVTPLGLDTTHAALAAGLDPRRTVALDPLLPASFAAGGRVTLMTSPATAPEAADGVHRALLAAGRKVTRIADSPGFIAQRMLAMVVATAAEIAQQRIASPSDIDAAVRLGLGYPQGPLALGDGLGAARVLEILTGLHTLTGDPRYRPPLWLRRRALLGLSLAAPDR
jgi:3-hydroxybutyryl-CoA dehydrogenase